LIARRLVPVRINAVLDDFDSGRPKSVAIAEAGCAEGAHGCNPIGHPVEEDSIGQTSSTGDHIRIVSAVLGQNYSRTGCSQLRRQRTIEKGRVLMRVEDLQPALTDGPREAPDDAEIEPRAPIERKYFDALSSHNLPESADAVQTKDDGFDPRTQTTDRLCHQHLSTSHLHDVKNKTDAKTFGQEALILTLRGARGNLLFLACS
jgi:hypothetical protein